MPELSSQVAFCARAAPGANAVTATSAVVASSAALRQFSRSHATERVTQRRNVIDPVTPAAANRLSTKP